jgi:predicted RNase H-like nuclease (RuvC/YqgF family)
LTEIEELSKFVDQQEKLVEQLDDDFSNLATANTEALSDAEMLSSANEIEAKIKAAKRNIANLQEKVQTLKDNLDPDLNAWFQGASKNVVNKASFLLEELDQLTIAIECGRKDLVREVVVVLQEAGSRSILSSIALLRGLW